MGGTYNGPGVIGPSSNLNSPLPSSPPLPYLPPARRHDNSSPEGSIPTAPSPLPVASNAADSPLAVTPPPMLIGSMGGGGWPNSSFFNLSSSPQHHRGYQQQQQQHQLLMGQLRPAVPPFGGAFSPFQVNLVFRDYSDFTS